MATEQAAKAVEKAAHGGGRDMLRHTGHSLKNGGTGGPHYQTNGVIGHTFWGGLGPFLVSMLNPFDAISGELGSDDMLEDGSRNELDMRYTPSDGCEAVESCQ
jgi:hypothetical protein